MTGRQAALDVLLQVYEKHAFLNLALKKVRLDDDRDQRFATALVNAVLENYVRIDFILSKFLNLKKTDPVALGVCRLGAAQILVMDGVPDRAAVYESVELIKDRRPKLRGFVNGVLRNVLRRRGEIIFPSRDDDPIEYLHVTYSYPKWICELFADQFGLPEAENILAYRPDTELTPVRLVQPISGREDLVPGIYLDDAAFIRSMRRIEHDPDFVGGNLTVQSESSMLCVRSAGIRPGMNVLDLCAAPGGKSLYAAQLADPGIVIASDLHPHRVELIRQNAERLHASNVTAQSCDARHPDPSWRERFDVVLVDAPCSALGLLYRKPDVKMFKQKEDLARLAALQSEILAATGDCVKPGGTLIYSTCTMDHLENEDVVGRFLEERPGFRKDALTDYLPGPFSDRGAGGDLQLLPPQDDIDGFYMARLVKV